MSPILRRRFVVRQEMMYNHEQYENYLKIIKFHTTYVIYFCRKRQFPKEIMKTL